MKPDRQKRIGVDEIIRAKTHGGAYVVVALPFESNAILFDHIAQVVSSSVGIGCIRADDILGGGRDIRTMVHRLIDQSELVIAEVSDDNANVYYEVGYAVGAAKTVLLVAKKGTKTPTDFAGLARIEYTMNSVNDLEVLDKRLSEHLRLHINPRYPNLRDMLIAPQSLPAYVVASPKSPGVNGQSPPEFYDRQTFGDNIGVLGLLLAFGSMLGERDQIELVHAQFCDRDLVAKSVNLYLVGSPKVNPLTRPMLEAIQTTEAPRWEFKETPTGGSLILTRIDGRRTLQYRGDSRPSTSGNRLVHMTDYGLIARGPHPRFADRLVLVLAGAHALGTGAACLAATKSSLIEKIKAYDVDVTDSSSRFWVLVKGTSQREKGLVYLDQDGVEIVEAGHFTDQPAVQRSGVPPVSSPRKRSHK